eukprot:NODE_12703_length_256_cov_41.472637.p3 GENE.NODE_12703_length_256_cov_41.472637~~NODE_12703_length_256_cov_41.472637.p3  ORF type:complete len:73 (+),score=25.12 NODE_12703_length_256_cov_41.472637:3-221(+)
MGSLVITSSGPPVPGVCASPGAERMERARRHAAAGAQITRIQTRTRKTQRTKKKKKKKKKNPRCIPGFFKKY